MTQDEIIRMAREAGLIHAQDTDGQWDGITNQQLFGYPYENPRDQEWAEKRIIEILKPFAALVAAHEKKFWMEQIEVDCNEAVLAEREACAKVCLKTGIKHPQQTGQEACAAAIRARGEE